ncbi:22162_t:CDS:1, partial [Gigaspora margarita]
MVSELEVWQHKENDNRKINGLSRYVLKYKEELKKRKTFHNLREKVIILNASKAYRDELETQAKSVDITNNIPRSRISCTFLSEELNSIN